MVTVPIFLPGLLWCAWATSRLALGGGRPVARAAGTIVAAAAILYLLLHALLALGLFRMGWALLALAILSAALGTALLSLGIRPAAEIEEDLRALARSAFFGVSPLWIAALSATALLGTLRLLRGLVLPPLGWDALVYHLFKAGRWVALGRHHVEDAPGAWGFYEWFPSGGDALWAWALLGARDGALLAPAGGAVWLSASLAAAFLARRLGAPKEGAIAAACAIGTMPAVAGALTASYVDTTLLALFLLGAAFLVPSESRCRGDDLLAGAALGLAGTVKASFLPAVPLVAAALVATRRGRRSLPAFLAGSVPFLAIEYARAVWEKGSPLWPFPLTLFGRTILAGDDELARQFAGFYAEDVIARMGRLEFLEWLFLWKRLPGSDFAGFGPLSALLLLLGLAVLPPLLRRSGIGFAAAACAAAAVVLASLAPENVAQRTVWVGVLGRHLAPAFALAVAAASTLRFPRAAPLWLAAIAAAWWLALPRGWGETDVAAFAALLVPLAAGGVVAALAAWGAVRITGSAVAAALLAAIAGAVPVAAVLPRLRAETRWEVWNETLGEQPVYDLHFLDPAAMSAWPAWKRLDDGGHRIAVTAGYAVEGQSWYLYPLLGSSLTNRVFYVPPTSDGAVPDTRDPERERARFDRDRFLARLVEEDVDVVMALWPPSLEREIWIDRLPEVFPVEGRHPEAGWALHRFDKEAALRLREGP